MSGAYAHVLRPEETIMVPIPPPNNQGAVQFGRVFLSLGTDFGAANVRLAVITAAGTVPIFQPNLNVPPGRNVVFEITQDHAVASLVHQSGHSVGVLVEHQ
jgi:hypothetical protein